MRTLAWAASTSPSCSSPTAIGTPQWLARVSGVRRRQTLMLAIGLLLGLLVYALELEAPPVYEPVYVEACTQAPHPEPPPSSEPDLPASALAQLLLVTDGGVVLSAEAAPSWGAGPLYERPGRSTYRVAKRAAIEELPAELATWRGHAFDLFGVDGKVCSARLGELHVVSQYEGGGLEGVLGEGWDEDALDDRFDGEKVPAEAWREQLWDAGPHWLVAEFVAEGDCEGALWARDAALPAPTVLKASAGLSLVKML